MPLCRSRSLARTSPPIACAGQERAGEGPTVRLGTLARYRTCCGAFVRHGSARKPRLHAGAVRRTRRGAGVLHADGTSCGIGLSGSRRDWVTSRGQFGHALGSHAVSDRDELLKAIKEKAIVHGDFILSSGQRASWYIDLRRVLLDGRAAPIAGRVMLATAADLGFDAVGGLTLGADPVATAMLHAAAAQGRPLDAFVVRKEGKAHGLQRRIEGPDVAGRRVLAVEDTSTTGGSVLTAVAALREAGAEVVGVAVVVERGARERVTAQGLPFRAAFELSDLGLG